MPAPTHWPQALDAAWGFSIYHGPPLAFSISTRSLILTEQGVQAGFAPTVAEEVGVGASARPAYH